MRGTSALAAYTCAITFTAHARIHVSFGAEAAFSRSGSLKNTPAFEQKSPIGPQLRSVSSITRLMSCSFDTSQDIASPAIAPATSCAPRASMSATTIWCAPCAWKRSHSARPIPFAPPVTTITLSRMFITEYPRAKTLRPLTHLRPLHDRAPDPWHRRQPVSRGALSWREGGNSAPCEVQPGQRDRLPSGTRHSGFVVVNLLG